MNYLKYEINEFVYLGKFDAISNIDNRSKDIEQSLQEKISKEGVDVRIKKYNLGYEIGLLKILSTPLEEDYTLDNETQLLILKTLS